MNNHAEHSVLLDLYCGAGGATRGYQQAGFEVVGVDHHPQPHYIGDHFIEANALILLWLLQEGYTVEDGCSKHHQWVIEDFAAIHASPPCQGYSIMHNLPWLRGREYPLLILPTLELLEQTGKPYVIENVMGARYGAKGLKKRGLEAHGLKAGYLCGQMFGLPFYRHRLFAANWLWLALGHPKHMLKGHPRSERWVYGGSQKDYRLDIKGGDSTSGLTRSGNFDPHWRKRQGGTLPKSKDGPGAAGFTLNGKLNVYSDAEDARGVASWPNRRHGNQGGTLQTWIDTSVNSSAMGKNKGWRLAKAAMGIDWEVTRAELTQMIPPTYTCYIGGFLWNFIEQTVTNW